MHFNIYNVQEGKFIKISSQILSLESLNIITLLKKAADLIFFRKTNSWVKKKFAIK